MDEASHGASKRSINWPSFGRGQTVAGMKVLDLIDWVRASDCVLDGGTEPEGMAIIAMPPVQRTSVWRPKQVLDLWDSLMHGLPIGTFYLVEQRAGARKLVRLCDAENSGTRSQTQSSTHAGFELLDGQQRVRALLAGACGPAEGKLCLWVDLGAEGAKQAPCLRVTSKAQPFGYDAESGGKLRMDQRRDARRLIEPAPEAHPLMCGDRPAYDLDLFDGQVTQNKELIERPPRPYATAANKTFTDKIFKLHDLLAAWRERSSDDPATGTEALRRALPEALRDNDTEAALGVLHKAFQRVKEAQVALLRVDPDKFENPTKELLTLFVRIGAGGTPLSFEERLFSIYKHHVPEIRDAVDAIHRETGRVLPPTKIAAAALRIANASDDYRPQYTVPSVGDFAKQMAGDPASKFRQSLDRLIPITTVTPSSSEGPLSSGFEAVKRLLSRDAGRKDAFWLPDVVLAALPAELWQVLVYWVVRRGESLGKGEDIDACRKELVRFALFWHFFIWNDEKAARWAFAYLRDTQDATHFPGLALYRRLVGTVGGDRCTCALVDFNEFTRRLSKDPSSSWRTDRERFGEGEKRNEVGAHWWWSGRKVLPWLQRDYVTEAFPGYMPLSDHEDDLPYDVDHICPWADCGDWFSVRTRIKALEGEPALIKRMQDGRDAVGNGIGNLRLVDVPANRGDQDADISCKMPFTIKDGASEQDKADMAKFAFPPEDWALWKKVSRPGLTTERQWDQDRLIAFQQAVEKRAAWLYCCFYGDLGYAAWVSGEEESTAMAEKP